MLFAPSSPGSPSLPHLCRRKQMPVAELEPSKRSDPFSSSRFTFIPRQIMLESNAAGAVAPAEAAAKGEMKKEKRKEEKRASSETLEFFRTENGGESPMGKVREILVRSIAAFLESNGFHKALSALQSEAQFEINCWKSTFLDLEKLLCKLLESSDIQAEAGINWLKELDPADISRKSQGKNITDTSEHSDKKKRKKFDEIDGATKAEACKTGVQSDKGIMDGKKQVKNPVDRSEVKIKEKRAIRSASEGSAVNSKVSKEEVKELKTSSEKDDLGKLAESTHAERREKKRKKNLEASALMESAEKKQLDVSHGTSKSTDLANQLLNSRENDKEKKKKKHKIKSDSFSENTEAEDSGKFKEMVKDKIEELKTLINNSSESMDKVDKKKEKKVKNMELEASDDATQKKPKDLKSVVTESDSYFGLKNSSDDHGSQKKEKKKKRKLASEGIPAEGSEQVEGEKSDVQKEGYDMDKDIGKTDIGNKSFLVPEDNSNAVEKKASKKRKRSVSEEKVNTIIVSESKGKSEGGDDSKEKTILEKAGKLNSDSEQNFDTKKRKTEKSKRIIKSSGEEHDVHTPEKTVVGNQMENGSFEVKIQEGDTLSKTLKKKKHSTEQKNANSFQRVKVGEVKFADERLQDNSYWAKDGADSGYGAKAQEILGQVRGRDFRHEKTKKKRGTYRGGQIDLHSHSIKFNYSDEE